ncbi:DNA polymerase I-like [Maniola jurtina]|uniref:DNA polymerase I-like n=1 Tax=Maniola jurtina TaxID=191418 RepID=UPI001E68DC76|nr:DNA polymerase I-like [Maniola jurtina]
MDKRKNGYYPCDQQIILKYERYLSPYGRKVMSALLHLKKERKTSNNLRPIVNPPAHSRYQNKRVLSFNYSETSRTLPIFNDLVTDNSDNTSIPELNLQNLNNNTVSLVSSPKDLLKPVLDNDIGVTKENVRHTNVTNCDSSTILQYSNHTENSRNVVNETSDDITWDNMFDTDILQYFEDTDKDKNKRDAPSHKVLALETVDNNEYSSKHEFAVKGNENVTEKGKLKVENAKVNVKKAKIAAPKIGNEKISFRKEKYTTTVKNWLNDMDPTNIVTDEYIFSHNNQENITNTLDKETLPVKEQASNNPKMEETISKGKKNKRSIQAQLANKDGVMKYKRPKYVVKNQINTENDQTTSADSNNNNVDQKTESIKDFNLKVNTKPIKEPNVKELKDKKAKSKGTTETIKETNAKVVKEKKVKAKFVVPIKSQIPVQDVTYKVVIINNLIDISTIICDLEKFEQEEGIMTMVYSNGFSQLNDQHTEDTCSPEGIMFHFQDTFYYTEGQVDGITNVLCRILSSNAIVSFDAKSVLVYLMYQYDINPNSFNIIDAKIGASLINPDEPPENFSDMQKLLGYTAEYTIATECTLQKVAWYMTLLKECSSKLKCLLLEQGLWKVFVDIEMKILPIMSDMEHRGISVDLTKLKSMEDILLTRIKEIESRCHKAAGKVFQINSTVQVRALIYDELQLDTTSNIKIRETICKGAKSTSEAMLRSLITVHPLPKLILEYRHLHKAHATFLAGIAQHVQDGVVKLTWDQTAAATGRIASNNPNLQAIPKMQFNLVLFPNDDDKDPQALNFRSVYVARPGYTLLAADFKHIECRVFAQAAADTGLLSALKSPDLFRVLAAKWLNKPESEVFPEDRERTKRMVYASLYGAGTRKLMEILNLGYDQVLSIMSSFNRTFPSLKSFGRSVVAQCSRQEGRLTTASGRARTFKNITSSDFQAKSHAERQAVNFIIQGTAADLCKMAMVLSTDCLRLASPRVEAHLLLQIHDELVWEVREQHLDTAAVCIKNAMENCGQVFGMVQTLPISMYQGSNWGEMNEYLPKLLE